MNENDPLPIFLTDRAKVCTACIWVAHSLKTYPFWTRRRRVAI